MNRETQTWNPDLFCLSCSINHLSQIHWAPF